MKIVYNIVALALMFCGAGSLFFNVDLPFESKSVLFSISSNALTLDMALFGGGGVLLLVGFLFGKVNN